MIEVILDLERLKADKKSRQDFNQTMSLILKLKPKFEFHYKKHITMSRHAITQPRKVLLNRLAKTMKIQSKYSMLILSK